MQDWRELQRSLVQSLLQARLTSNLYQAAQEFSQAYSENPQGQRFPILWATCASAQTLLWRWTFSFCWLGIFLVSAHEYCLHSFLHAHLRKVLLCFLNNTPLGRKTTTGFPQAFSKLNKVWPSHWTLCAPATQLSQWPPARLTAVVLLCCSVYSSHHLLIYYCFFHYPAV